jgi:hypothetical protein
MMAGTAITLTRPEPMMPTCKNRTIKQDSAHANMPDGREHTTIQNLTEQGASGFVIDNTNGAEAAKDQMPTPQEETSKDAENPRQHAIRPRTTTTKTTSP